MKDLHSNKTLDITLLPLELVAVVSNGQLPMMRQKRTINEIEVTDLVKAIVAPVRPYGCVFAYSWGAQKCIRGNYHFFEMDQKKIGDL